jgi:hypothetical protein
VTLENDDLQELTNEIRRLIDSNRQFLERVSDEEYDDDEDAEELTLEPEQEGEGEGEDFEEL